jgi:hypothetical protein
LPTSLTIAAWRSFHHASGRVPITFIPSISHCIRQAYVFCAAALSPLLSGATICGMCRNIRTLHNFEPPASGDEVHAAALQYVRKISGSTKPSQANAEAFERAVDEIAAVSARLLGELVTSAPPKDREVEAARRRARSAQRFAA